MPAGDRTGPMGMGPMSGRAAGYCAGYPAPGYMQPGPGRGAWGWGRGGGMGLGRGFRGGRGWGQPHAYPAPHPAPYPAEVERDVLQGQIEYLEDALNNVRQRIAELEAPAGERE